MRGDDEADLIARLAPVEAEVRKRLGNFIIAEDDQTLEGVVLAALLERGHTLATAEMFSGGHLAARMAPLPGAEKVFRKGVVTRDAGELGINGVSAEAAQSVGRKLRDDSRASHALALLIDLDEGPDRPDFGGTVCIGIADAGRHGGAPGAPDRQPRLDPRRRRRDGAGLPAPPSARPAGRRAHRLRAALTPALQALQGTFRHSRYFRQRAWC